MKIRFHPMFSTRDAERLNIGYTTYSDSISIYFEVADHVVLDVLSDIETKHPELRHSFVSSKDGGYYYVY